MSSEVDISNLALSHLGDEAQVAAINPPDGSVQAGHCGRFYPIARDVLLEAHAWTFATKRIALAQVDNPSPFDWSYAYALPSTCLRPLSALLPGTPAHALSQDTDNDSHPYIIEAGQDGELVMYTNVQASVLRYIDKVTDPSKFSPGFTVAFSRLLAAYLAGPVLKGKEGRAESQNQLKLFDMEYRKATAANANIGRRDSYQTRTPAHIAARGGFTHSINDSSR